MRKNDSKSNKDLNNIYLQSKLKLYYATSDCNFKVLYGTNIFLHLLVNESFEYPTPPYVNKHFT